MCGIFIYLCKKDYKSSINKGDLYNAFMQIKNRGPDRSQFIELSDYNVCLGFHRLAIMDTSLRGDQPFTFENESKQIFVLCNGEIYNFKELCEKYGIELKSGSDCEVILHLYLLIGLDATIKELLGEFAFCICECDKVTGEVRLLAGRDILGIRPLYLTGDKNEVILCSELKASPFLFSDHEYFVDQFKPRHYLEISSLDDNLCDPNNLKYTQWFDLRGIPITIFDLEEAKAKIKEAFDNAVDSMIDGDRELCCFLSGGLDSSLVSSRVAQKYRKLEKILRTFSIGLDSGSTDEPYARMVSQHIGSDHTHVIFTEQNFLNGLEEVVSILSTFDITSIRATVPQYMLAKWVSKHTNIKIIKGGDVSDELTQGYKYFIKTPDANSSHDESIFLLENIHLFDVKRGDRGIASNGIELRLPFGHKNFITTYLSIDPKLRMVHGGVEKWLLRETFKDTNYLPEEVIKRSKEAFSDAISTQERSWYVMIQEHVESLYSDEDLKNAQKYYTYLPPISKEALHYRLLFEKYYGPHSSTARVLPFYWLPKWCGNITEPSARVLDVYK